MIQFSGFWSLTHVFFYTFTPRVQSNHLDPPVRLMSELSDLDKFTPLQWHDCRIFGQLEFFADGEIGLGKKDSTFLLKDKWLSSLSTVLLSNLPYCKACEWKRRSNDIHGMRRCSYIYIIQQKMLIKPSIWGMYPRVQFNFQDVTMIMINNHDDRIYQDSILGWFSSNEDFLLLPIDATKSRISGLTDMFDTPDVGESSSCFLFTICNIYIQYISLATQQFQAWTPNGSNHESRTDLRFRCCLPLGVSSESSKYINFLSDWLTWLNFHEPRSGNDANIRSFWFSNSSLKQISSNSVYIFLRISPHLWERTNDRQWNWWEQYVACVCVLAWQLVHCGSLHSFD